MWSSLNDYVRELFLLFKIGTYREETVLISQSDGLFYHFMIGTMNEKGLFNLKRVIKILQQSLKVFSSRQVTELREIHKAP